MGKRPNILLILTDQQYAGAMSCTGNPDLHTPAMDSLAETGVRFERAYCTQPLCSPARASLITGLMPHQAGVTGNNQEIEADLRGRELGRWFEEAGYDCAYAGKWHIPSSSLSEGHGFRALGPIDDADLPRQCSEFLDRERNRPFLLVASFVNPHDICQWARSQPLPRGAIEGGSTEDCPDLPPNFSTPPFEPEVLRTVLASNMALHPGRDWPDEHWRHYRHAYYRLVEKVDGLIGEVLHALRESGLEEETLIVFSSDHGDGHGAHKWNQKTALYEECVRIPLIVSYRGVTAAGGVDDVHLVSNGLDLLPTLCDYAGIDPPEGLPGLSLRSLADEEEAKAWRDELVLETELGYAISGPTHTKARALLTDRYKYCIYPLGRYREQLIDMKADPGEMVNLAYSSRYRHVLVEHRSRLARWSRETGDAFQVP